MTVHISIEGAELTAHRLNNLSIRETQELVRGIKHATFFIAGEVKESIAGRRTERASVDTGRFLQSVHNTSAGTEGTVSSNVSYAKFLEFGTSKMAARRHFSNTAARNAEKVRAFLDERVKRVARSF